MKIEIKKKTKRLFLKRVVQETSVRNETERYNLLVNGSNDPEVVMNYFLFEGTYYKLKSLLET
jgi:hypothetical protein